MSKWKKYYVVREGKKTWIFDSRDECQKYVLWYTGAKYKSFTSNEEAKQARESGPEDFYNKKQWHEKDIPFEKNSIAVDAACSGNPGELEYKWIDLQSGKVIFQKKFDLWTNNIGEFLAIVHWLVYLKENTSDMNIYSDSKRAIKRISEGKCKTQMKKEKKSDWIFEVIKRAEEWLKNNKWKNKILKRDTANRWEIPADFWRK